MKAPFSPSGFRTSPYYRIGVCVLAVAFSLSAFPSSARATLITAYHYEIAVSGTFGTAINPAISNLPDATYPHPLMRGGSFAGSFVYDSMAHLDDSFEGRFPYESLTINLYDNTGGIARTITSGPNKMYVTENILQLTFGPSFGIPYGLEDLRLLFNGSFTRDIPPPPPELPGGWGDYNIWTVPPSPEELVSGALSLGFLETDGSRPFTYWDLPVDSVSLAHIGTTAYLREVPDAGYTIGLMATAGAILLAARRRGRK